ncbi:MAG: carboxypeptidase regulatory-like domain-containing protein [Chloracidobacterium sp.]|nr:carboxypeptidase regulatory-like domain-containing protein [Chloracidobacterium sp.]
MHRISKRYFRLAVCTLLAASCLLLTAYAQNTGGAKGKVRNLRGDSLSGATVTARLNGKDVASANTNGKGEFVITGLESGVYNFVFDAKGYATGIKYGVEVKSGKTRDLGGNLILMVDRGSRVVIQGSVFFKDGTSVTAAKVTVDKVNAEGGTQRLGSGFTNVSGEFTFSQPEGRAKYRITATYKDSTASKEIEVETAAIYRTAISLDINRDEK